MLDLLLTMNTFGDLACEENIDVHLIRCHPGAGRDYERNNRKVGLITDAVSILLDLIFCVGPEMSPGLVITGVILNAEFFTGLRYNGSSVVTDAS